MHSAVWNKDYDYANKRIGVIGNGSSAIQIVPKLVEEAAHLTNFVRRPTYITPGLGSAIIGGATQHVYSEEEKKRFRDDPEYLKQYRKKIQHGSNVAFEMFAKGSEAQAKARQETADMMAAKLNHDEELTRKLTPEWEVGCRRATPGPGYLESFTRDNVSLVSESIEAVEEKGIRTVDGKLHEFDAIVCATGFDVSHRPPWPLVGRHGLTLAEAWEEEPMSYLSLAASGFPNFFMFSGPNAPVGHGSLMAGLQWSADWMVQWIRKMAAEDIAWVDVRPEVVDEFNAYADEIMQTLVWSGGCQSWYKNHRVDGKVTAVWAGSVIGYKEMIDHIRPEDFEIKYRSKNRFRFMVSTIWLRRYFGVTRLTFSCRAMDGRRENSFLVLIWRFICTSRVQEEWRLRVLSIWAIDSASVEQLLRLIDSRASKFHCACSRDEASLPSCPQSSLHLLPLFRLLHTTALRGKGLVKRSAHSAAFKKESEVPEKTGQGQYALRIIALHSNF